MKQKDKHKSLDLPKGAGNEFISKTDIPFQRTKDEVWESLSGKLDNASVAKSSSNRLPTRLLYIAASFALLITTVTLYMRYHSLEFLSQEDITEISLPDGSNVEMRAYSQITYHPHWWRFRREINMEGEAYFDVEHGESFKVVSPQGSTEVLGTTFTVIDRSNLYRVSCFSGSVRVQAVNKDVAATIMANEEVVLDENGNYNVRMINSQQEIESITEEAFFIFNAVSVSEVFSQLEQQYDVQIELADELDFVYSGNLNRNMSIADVLSAVCMSLGLKYEKTSDNKYIITSE